MLATVDEKGVSSPIKVLVADDSPADARLAVAELRRAAILNEHRIVSTEGEYRAALIDFVPDVILCDFSFPDFDGPTALKIAREICPWTPFIFVTGTISEDRAVIAVQNGAVDYVLKSSLIRLAGSVLRAVEEATIKKQRETLESHLNQARDQLANISSSISEVLASFSLEDRRFLYVSPAAEQLYGYGLDSFLAWPNVWREAILPEDQPVAEAAAQRLFETGSYDIDYRITHRSGAIRWVNHRARLASDATGKPIRVDSVVLDITDRMEQQTRLRRLIRIRDLLSSVNAAIIRIRDRAELFRDACRIAFEAGGFTRVDIFSFDSQSGEVVLEATFGKTDPVERETLQRVLTEGRAEHVVWRALHRLEPAVVNNLDSAEVATFAGLTGPGIRGLGIFPLTQDDKPIGAMVLGTQEADFFDSEEIELLASLCGNLSFALNHLAEQQRVTRLRRIRDVLSAVNQAIVHVQDRDALLGEAARVAFQGGGFVNVFAFLIEPKTGRVSLRAVAGRWAGQAEELQKSLQQTVDGGLDAASVVSVALRTKAPAVVNDLEAECETVPVYRRLVEQGVGAMGAFPLIVDGDVAGALVFDTVESGIFDEEEVELLSALAGNLSFALEHLQRQERVTRLSRIRDVFSSVNAAIIRIHDRAELCQEVCRIAVEAGGFINVYVAEFDLDSREFHVTAFLGESNRDAVEETRRAHLLRDRKTSSIENALRTLRPIVRNDIKSVGRRALEGINASGTFPLIVDKRGVAAMVFETAEAGYFDDEEIELVTNLVNNLSFALNLIDKQQRVAYLSYYDALTQLPNRTLFYDRLGQDIAASEKGGKMLAVVLLDLARFSILNNTLGEHVGDEVLRRVAARLRDSVSESRIARVAGDRFALCFPMLDDLRPVTDIVTDEGIRLLEAPFAVADRELHIAARAGCAVFPNDGNDAESLFQNAEAALQGAKSAGTSYRFYAPELNARFASQLDLEARLQRAIEERQFVLHYQPKVSVTTHEVVGFEALIRWNDPERGLVAPGSFIPLLEQTGVIIPVGRWALTEAARQYEEWRAQGFRVPRIAVNLSTVQLRSDRVVDDVKAAVDMFSHDCGLDVEVTESMLMENFDTAIAKLTAIRDLGVNLSLDDFGTGYSSLAYIHRLPLNALKIDRSFIVGMTDDPNKTSIVSTIISLGMALRLKIIAEGVEHEEEARLLQLLRCDMIQGYLFGKPEPPEVAVTRLTR